MSEPLVNEEEWAGWLALPATKALREVAAARRALLMESWAEGGFQVDPGLNAKAIGECQAYGLLAQLDYQTVIIGELTDEPASSSNHPSADE